MGKLNVQVTHYGCHRNGKCSSYKGTVGRMVKARLKHRFTTDRLYQKLVNLDMKYESK